MDDGVPDSARPPRESYRARIERWFLGGVAHPIWTDSRRNTDTSTGCARGLMEEVFTASVK